MNLELLVILILGVGGLAIVVVAIAYLYYVRVWFRAYTAGSPVPFIRLFGLTARRLSPYRLVIAYANAREAGIRIALDELEEAYAAGGDPRQIVQCIIDAKNQGRAVSVHEASEQVGRSGHVGSTAINQEG